MAPAGDLQTLARTASALFRSGPLDQAIEAYRRLLSAYPDLPDSWYNLGLLRYRARDFSGAIGACEQALALGILGPEEVHLQIGVILSDGLGDSNGAFAQLKTALSLNPDYGPAWLNLGNLHEDRGEATEAEHAYRRALEIEPGLPLALARLAGLKRAVAADDPLITDLRAALVRPQLDLLDRADLGFALGRLLDLSGDYADAFEVYSAANRASASLGGEQGHRYDRAAQDQLVDRIIAAWPVPSMHAAPAVARSPIFICGMFRSGSTLVERILSSHSDIVAGGELSTVAALVQTRLPRFPEDAATLPPGDFAQLRDLYLAETAHRRSGGRRMIDKQPTNLLYVGMLKGMFPDARFIFTRRAMLDNCLSVFFLHADPALAYATDLADTAHQYYLCERLMAHWQRLYPGEIAIADYDRLTAAPREEMERLVRFCDLEWQDEILGFADHAGAVRTASNWQVRQPIHTRSSGRWRHYEAQLARAGLIDGSRMLAHDDVSDRRLT